MKIEKIEIRYAHKNTMTSNTCNRIKHIKSLPWLSVVQSQEGSYDIQLDDCPLYKTGDGGFFIAPSQVVQTITHFTNPESKLMRNRWIFLDIVINNKYRLDYLYDFPTIIPAEIKDSMNSLFDKLFLAGDLCDEMSIYYQIVKLLLQIAEPKSIAASRTLLSVLDYIRQHYAEDISMEQLSAAAYISKSYLYEIFKKNLGTSPIAYLNHYRLSVASEMLKQTDEPIGKISELVGFHDPAYFNRLFRRTFLVAPREYRKSI
ncbi:MAG: helix-turn-helix transcriptional regulator [Roseburia sp.]|nr:helix-turn-helix transcriptional regulator [Roseburia sp.]